MAVQGDGEPSCPTSADRSVTKRVKVMRHCIASMPEALPSAPPPFPIDRTAAGARETTVEEQHTRVRTPTHNTSVLAVHEALGCRRAGEARDGRNAAVGVAPP
jgi:hypothetical protein